METINNFKIDSYMQSLEEFESADYLPMLKHERQGE